MKIVIIVMRHGQKDGDALTALGEHQVTASAKLLALEKVDRIISSGANRTARSAAIVQHETGFQGECEVDTMFNFVNLVGPTGGKDKLLNEIAYVQANGDTVAIALETSEYARAARRQLTTALLTLANDMFGNGESLAVVCSHGNFSEMAVWNTADFPYGIPEASWVRYVIEDGQILMASLHQCPIPGGRN